MPNYHPNVRPSSAHRWLRCLGSVAMEAMAPDNDNIYSEEGHVAHLIGECVLRNRIDIANGKDLWAKGGCETAAYLNTHPLAKDPKRAPGDNGPVVDEEMVEKVGEYVDTVWELAQGNELLIEQRIDFSEIVGVPGQSGTADAVILTGDELQIHDLKYGAGKWVSAYKNEQLQLYALGALNQFGMLQDFNSVRLFIHQPRRGNVSEWAISIEELNEFAERAREATAEAFIIANISKCENELPLIDTLTPGDIQCHFCKAKAICPGLERGCVNAISGGNFCGSAQEDPQIADAVENVPNMDLTHLGEVYSQLGIIKLWTEAIDARALKTMSEGIPVPGLKLIEGRKGKREWGNDEEAVALLKDQFRYKNEVVYTAKVISPTQAETLIKKAKPRQWAKLEKIITRADGKPKVVLEDDPRPALILNPENDFDDVDAAEAAAEFI